MKVIFRFWIFIGIIAISSCSPKIITNLNHQSQSLNQNDEIMVLSMLQGYPDSYEELGVVKIKDTGFSVKCKYDRVIELAKLEARKAGGNVLKITELEEASFTGSSCDQISALILKVDDINSVNIISNQVEVDLNRDYATFYIYRKRSGQGSLIGYPIYYGDSALCYVKNNFKRKFKIYNVDPSMVWARTEVKQEIPVIIEKGKDYYFRCGIQMGLFVGQPKIFMVDNITGKTEYMSIISNMNEKDLIVLKNGTKVECDILSEDRNKVVIKTLKNGEEVTAELNRSVIKDIVYQE